MAENGRNRSWKCAIFPSAALRSGVRKGRVPEFDFGTGCAYFGPSLSFFCSELAGMERTTRSSGLCYSVQAPTCLVVQMALPLLPLGVINVNIHRLLFLYRFPLSGGRSGGG